MNSKLISRIKKIKRQSFDSRICDDLCEVILQFLPIRDKFRLECVSKQFQRTVFQKVLGFAIFRRKRFKFYLNLLAVKLVLKKCPNIQYVDSTYGSIGVTEYQYNLIIEWIIKYCKNLTQFYGDFDLMNDRNKRKFIEKFGSKLKFINFNDTSDINILKLVPNIKELDLNITQLSYNEIYKIQFKELKTLIIRFHYETHPKCVANALSIFIETNPQIKVLSLTYYSTKDSVEFNLVLDQISRLKSLVKLRISRTLNLRLSETSLTQIAVNCPKLKTIGFNIFIDYYYNQNISELLSPLKVFKQLRRLSLSLSYPNFDDIDIFSFKVFKGFEYLTHLWLDILHYNCDVKDTILADIDINLPKLRSLSIVNQPISVTEEIHIILSRLSSLHTINIMTYIDNNMKDIIKTKLIERKKYKSIKL